MVFKIDQQVFYVPLTFLVMVFDFDFVHSELWQNVKVYNNQPMLAKQHGVCPETCPGYDTHLFFVPLQQMRETFDAETLDFLDDVVPPGYRINEKYTVGAKKENRFRAAFRPESSQVLWDPLRVLCHPYFRSLQRPPAEGKIIPYVFEL